MENCIADLSICIEIGNRTILMRFKNAFNEIAAVPVQNFWDKFKLLKR